MTDDTDLELELALVVKPIDNTLDLIWKTVLYFNKIINMKRLLYIYVYGSLMVHCSHAH